MGLQNLGLIISDPNITAKVDTVAEWLRRVTRNHLGFSRAGSNPAGVAFLVFGRSNFESTQ